MHARRFVVSLLLLLCLSMARPGSVPGAEAVTPQDRVAAFRADVQLVLHAVAVLDSDGQPVTGLAREEFHVLEDGTPQEIGLFLAPDAAPLDVALVLDSSNSLSFWASVVRRAARTFLLSLEPEDCVYLLPFNERVGPGMWGRAIDPTLGRRIDGIFMGGSTALYDAVLDGLVAVERATTGVALEVAPEPAADSAGGPAVPAPESLAGGGLDLAAVRAVATEQAGAATTVRARCGVPAEVTNGTGPQRRRALVLLTDGADEASLHRFDEVLDLARQASIPIFPVIMGEARKDEQLRATLEALAGNTGGTVIETVAADQLRSAYDDVVSLLRASYLIGYRPIEEAGGRPGWHQVRVRSRRPSYRLVHRERYFR